MDQGNASMVSGTQKEVYTDNAVDDLTDLITIN